MRHKTILLASAAAAALIIAQPAEATGLYFSASGGANFVEDQNGSFTTDFFRGTNTYRAHFDPETGFLLETAVGLELDHWLHGLRTELAMSYRRNSIDGHWSVSTSISDLAAMDLFTGNINGHTSTFALMANAWYEFAIGSRFKPYLGGGVGWARSKLDGAFEEPVIEVSAAAVDPFDGFSVTSSGFAYQLGAGVTTQVMPGVSLGLGYRYFDAPNTEIFFGGKISNDVAPLVNSSNSIKFDNVSHSVALSLSIDIN